MWIIYLVFSSHSLFEMGPLCSGVWGIVGPQQVWSRIQSRQQPWNIPLGNPPLPPLLPSSITRVAVAKGPTLERSCVSLGEYASCADGAAFWLQLTAVHVGQSFASHLLSWPATSATASLQRVVFGRQDFAGRGKDWSGSAREMIIVSVSQIIVSQEGKLGGSHCLLSAWWEWLVEWSTAPLVSPSTTFFSLASSSTSTCFTWCKELTSALRQSVATNWWGLSSLSLFLDHCSMYRWILAQRRSLWKWLVELPLVLKRFPGMCLWSTPLAPTRL